MHLQGFVDHIISVTRPPQELDGLCLVRNFPIAAALDDLKARPSMSFKGLFECMRFDLLGISYETINVLQHKRHFVVREEVGVPELEFCNLHVVVRQSLALCGRTAEPAMIARFEISFALVGKFGDRLDALAPRKELLHGH